MVTNFGILFFREIFQIDKFEGADFKYENSFFKTLPQKCPNQAFLFKETQVTHFWSQI